MFETLKIIHMLALFGGGAAGIGNGILMARVMASGAPPDPIVADSMTKLGKTGLASVILLWVTGIWMYQMSYADAALGWEFWVKLIGATVLLVAIVSMSVLAARAAKSGQPPDRQRIKMLSRSTAAGAVVAVIFAVTTFN